MSSYDQGPGLHMYKPLTIPGMSHKIYQHHFIYRVNILVHYPAESQDHQQLPLIKPQSIIRCSDSENRKNNRKKWQPQCHKRSRSPTKPSPFYSILMGGIPTIPSRGTCFWQTGFPTFFQFSILHLWLLVKYHY